MVAIPVNCKKAEKSSTIFFVQERHPQIEKYRCPTPVVAPNRPIVCLAKRRGMESPHRR